jgi:hypothetical protein
LTFRFAEQCRQLGLPGMLAESRRQRFTRTGRTTEVQIQLRQNEPRGNEIGRERQRLDQFRPGFADQILRARHSIRHAEVHVRVGEAWVDRQDGLEFLDHRLRSGRAAVQVGSGLREPLLNGGSSRRPRARGAGHLRRGHRSRRCRTKNENAHSAEHHLFRLARRSSCTCRGAKAGTRG